MVLVKAVCFKDLGTNELIGFLQKKEQCQVVNSRVVAGEKHVLLSVEQTLKAFARNQNIARSQSLEFLVRLSGQRQISKSVKECAPGKDSVFVSWSKDPHNDWREFCKQFGVKETQMPEKSNAEIMQAMERSATFWLNV